MRTPLLVSLLLSVAVMLGLSLVIVVGQFRSWQDIQRVANLSNFIAQTGDYVHELQIERGLTVMYLGGGDEVAYARLKNHRIKTDLAHSGYQRSFFRPKSLDDGYHDDIRKTVLKAMEQTDQIREAIDQRNTTPNEAFNFYSRFIANLLSLRQVSAHGIDHSILQHAIAGLDGINEIKEFNGQIRALGSEGFASGELRLDSYQKLVQLVGIQDEHIKELSRLFSPKGKKQLNDIHGSQEFKAALLLRDLLMDQNSTNLPREESLPWFDGMTAYINKLKDLEDTLIADLKRESNELRNQMMFKFYGLIAVLTVVLGVVFISLWRGERLNRRIRKELEETLRIEQARSSQILRAMTEAVCIVGSDGKIKFANPAMLQAFGEDAMYSNASEILPCAGSQGCQLLAGELGKGSDQYKEVKCTRSDRTFSLHCSPLNTHRHSKARLIVMNDITDRKLAEQNLIKAKEAAELASKSKSRMLANMSHELRTPLNAIIGFSDMILNSVFGPLKNDHYESYTRDIHQSGKLLLDLISDILDVSAIEAGKIELEMSSIDIDDVIDDAVRLIMPRAHKAKVDLEVMHRAHWPKIYGDQRRLKQIFLNLLSNAVKFTQKGGRVVIETANAADGNMMIKIVDTGVGMTPEELKIAKEPFGQASSGMNRKHEGSGLGLPLVEGLLELHGGSLEIESKKNVGTSITLILPCDDFDKEDSTNYVEDAENQSLPSGAVVSTPLIN